ncbi:general vesicular transport factor p115-like isoform X2 [Amphiura filiformis]|uniref:general vesicular transport factor p115-like isoform X2 n=1 Tax=Amphiura filiformis TaxID=82378 RepID=UPI003B215977
MSWFRNVLGSGEPGVQPTGADTIARLCDRVQSSTLLDDRRDAVRALKSLSKKFRVEVGTQALDILINVLQTDRSDCEIMGYALDTIFNIIAAHLEPEEVEEESPAEQEARMKQEVQLSEQFIDIFLKRSENVSLVLGLLEEYEFKVRWPAIKTMTALSTMRASQVQQLILVSPQGVSKLMDLLSDTREVVRNDGLLLLTQLTKGNANIQKIVAFENAFDRLLEIIAEEGASDGGIVVEDCLLLLLNLLKKNSSNQTFFKEGSFIQRLAPFFDLKTSGGSSPDGSWSAQKVNNVNLMLQVVRTLVSPSNPQQATSVCQKVIHQCGLLKQLCGILMASGVPADILTETINTVSEVIRGSKLNQEFFAAVNAPSNPPRLVLAGGPLASVELTVNLWGQYTKELAGSNTHLAGFRPAIVVLLMSMVNEKQPYVLRCAVLYCFECFLYKNEIGQEQIIATLLPATADVQTVTAGQLLCGGLFSQDSLANWFAAVALAHALKDNTTQKEQLLRVQLATGLGNPPVSLLQQCTNILAQPTAKVQTRVGLLILLCNWLSNCQLAVSHFLTNPSNIPFLTAQVAEHADEHESLVQGLCAFLLGISIIDNDNANSSFTKESLRQLIAKRVGEESFIEKLEGVSKHELYTQAAQKPQLRFSSPDAMLFDYEFTSLYKHLESQIVKAIQESDDIESKKTVEDHDNIVTQYKDIIREQDNQLSETKKKYEDMKTEFSKQESQLSEQSSQIQQLKDQYALLKAQHGVNNTGQDLQNSTDLHDSGSEEISRLQAEVDDLRQQLADKDSAVEKLKNDLTVAEAKAVLNTDGTEEGNGEVSVVQTRLEEQQQEIQELKRTLAEQRDEVTKEKQRADDLSSQLEEKNNIPIPDNSALIAEKAAMSTKISDLESKLSHSESEISQLQSENQRLQDEKQDLESRLSSQGEGAADVSQLNDELQKLKLENERLSSEGQTAKEDVAQIRQEQEDLLVLLTDTDEKKDKYKEKLKELGQPTSDDEDGEEAEDEEEEEEDGDED